MDQRFRGKLLLCCLLFAPAKAEQIIIGLGNFAPFFGQPEQPALFKDIIDSVYRRIPERQVIYRYMLSNARLVKVLNEGKVDGAANMFNQNEVQGCLTDPVFKYKDVVISLQAKHLQIKEVADLADKSIVTYQRARNLLGQEFRKVTEHHSEYQEVAHPAQQAKLVATGMVDVSIGDQYIFLHSLNQWDLDGVNANNFDYQELFPAVYSSMAFAEQRHCDEFNQALAEFKKSGEYDALYIYYLSQLGYQSAH